MQISEARVVSGVVGVARGGLATGFRRGREKEGGASVQTVTPGGRERGEKEEEGLGVSVLYTRKGVEPRRRGAGKTRRRWRKRANAIKATEPGRGGEKRGDGSAVHCGSF